jgi:hypothetical protein
VPPQDTKGNFWIVYPLLSIFEWLPIYPFLDCCPFLSIFEWLPIYPFLDCYPNLSIFEWLPIYPFLDCRPFLSILNAKKFILACAKLIGFIGFM